MPYRYKEIAPLYYGLIEDIKRMADYTRTISEGYDLAQAAICFPCAYVDKKLSDKVVGKYGKMEEKKFLLFRNKICCGSAVM